MTAIALELHEVLHEEYLRTGGKPLPSPDDPIVADDILDAAEAKERIGLDPKVETLVERLEEYRANVGDDAARRLCELKGAAARLTPATCRLKEGYAEASPLWRSRINRRILEDILGKGLDLGGSLMEHERVVRPPGDVDVGPLLEERPLR